MFDSLWIDKNKVAYKDISILRTWHILVVKMWIEQIKELFFNWESVALDEIGFFVKQDILWFDVLVVSDNKLIEHEICESITDLFLSSNQPKISIFKLWELFDL